MLANLAVKSLIGWTIVSAYAMASCVAYAASPTDCLNTLTIAPESVAAAAREIGGSNVTIAPAQGSDDFSLISFDLNGAYYVALPICDAGGTGECKGVLIMSGVSMPEGKSVTADNLNEFNRSNGSMATAYLSKKLILASRYVHALGGISDQNLRENFTLFKNVTFKLRDFISQPPVAFLTPNSSQIGGANIRQLSHPSANREDLASHARATRAMLLNK